MSDLKFLVSSLAGKPICKSPNSPTQSQAARNPGKPVCEGGFLCGPAYQETGGSWVLFPGTPLGQCPSETLTGFPTLLD